MPDKNNDYEKDYEKNYKEKYKKPVAKPFRTYKFRNISFERNSVFITKKLKQLSPSAVVITVRFPSACRRNNYRYKKAQQTYPCKQYVKKAENKINSRKNP